MKNLFKDRKPGFYLTLIAAGLAIVGAIVYLIMYQATADPVTGTVDRVFNWLNFALMLAGGLIALGGETLRLRFVPIVAGACYAIGLARHLVETAYPLADVLTKVPFFGGDPTLAVTFAAVFGLAALIHVVSSFMEHNQVVQ